MATFGHSIFHTQATATMKMTAPFWTCIQKTYSGEGSCYNREHAFPRSWFGGAVSPMNTDVHHVFATDGYVNGRRSSYPYGDVASATYTSSNGSKLGAGSSASGYTGTVFEPIDEFKGDFARAYLAPMATQC